MSGMSLAVGQFVKTSADDQTGAPIGSFSLFQLQMAAYTVVFAASGLVPIGELAFVGIGTVYIVILATLVFPRIAVSHPPGIVNVHRWFGFYIGVGSVLGLFLPMAYILGGFSRGDKAAVSGAVPHVFLMAVQLLTEQFIVEKVFVSLPVRAIVPIMYNARRLVSIGFWIRTAFNSEAPDNDIWLLFGKGLSITNMVFWTFNLCAFLIPLFLPRAFRLHFELEEERKKGVPESKLVEGDAVTFAEGKVNGHTEGQQAQDSKDTSDEVKEVKNEAKDAAEPKVHETENKSFLKKFI